MPNGLKLGILAVFVVICLSNSPLSISFGEEDKMIWIIEDESDENQYQSTKFDDSDANNIFKNTFGGKNSDKDKSEQIVELELSK